MSIESVMLSNHVILSCPLLLCLQSFPASESFWISSSHHVMMLGSPKCWNFSISPSNEYSGLISFRIDWFDLLAVQGILKSLLQHHNLNASVFQCPAFFMVQLSHLYMTTGKTVTLTIWAFVGKVISLLFTMRSRLVIALKWTINLLKNGKLNKNGLVH